MRLKKLGVIFLVLVVLGVIAASSAFAANEFKETGAAWYTGAAPGTKLAEGTSKAATVEAVGKQSLEGAVAGETIDTTAQKFQCSIFSSCSERKIGTSATFDGTYELLEVTISKPAGCSISSTIETNELTTIVGMNAAGTKVIYKYTPKTGTNIAVFPITGSSCAIAGTYKLTGTLFGEALNATGVFRTTQQVNFSKAIQEAAGTSTSLKFGENAAILTGAVKASIGGTEWAVKEK